MSEGIMQTHAGVKHAQPVDAHVGSRIRFRRNLLGLSQTELGDRIGVTFQQVQKYEKGLNRIGASRLMRICDVLQVTPAWLFEGVSGWEDKAIATGPDLDTAFAAFQGDHLAPQVLLAWARLSNPLKRATLALMAALAEAPTH